MTDEGHQLLLDVPGMPDLGGSGALPAEWFEDVAATARLLSAELRKGSKSELRAVDVRYRAYALLHYCTVTGRPPPAELLHLIRDLLDVNETHAPGYVRHLSAGSYSEAARFEGSYPPDPTGTNPSTAPLNAVARAGGVEREAVRKWRIKEDYRELVEVMRSLPKA